MKRPPLVSGLVACLTLGSVFAVQAAHRLGDRPQAEVATTASARPEAAPEAPPPGPAQARPKQKWDLSWGKVENPARDGLASTQLILRRVDAKPGMRIADIGAGVGYFAFKLAPVVGDAGHVFATDCDLDMTQAMSAVKEERGTQNLTVIKTQANDLGLGQASVDTVMMINSIVFPTCLDDRNRSFMEQSARALRPGGRLLIFQEWMHGADFVPPVGIKAECPEHSLDETAKLGGTWFDVASKETIRPDSLTASMPVGITPGFLLVLRKKAGGR